MRIALLPGLAIVIAIAVAQDKPQFTARELFYTPITEAAPEPAKDAGSKTSVAKPAKPKAGGRESAQSTTTQSTTSGTKIQNVSTTAEEHAGVPLALKYRLLKRNNDGIYDEVDTDTVFRSGDKIKVSVESNDAAYLYIVQQGSSKTWNLLFPNDETDNGNNRVDRNREIEVPGGGRFAFDEQAGEEHLFVVLTRRPEADLEKLIYALSQGSGTGLPASVDKSKEKSKMMLAQNKIDNSVIDGLRGQVLARDLVFEKVNDDVRPSLPKGTRKEKASYVASQDRTSKAKIIVDLKLKHQ